MDLKGKKVNSKGYGSGIITAVDNDIITISFSDCEKCFSFPKGFETGFLSFENEDDQIQVNKIIFEKQHPVILENKNEDRIINENVKIQTEEQKELSPSQIKIEELRSLVLENKSIAIELINQFDNSDFEKELFSRSFSVMRKVINDKRDYSEKGRALIIVAMTFLALKYYDSGNLESFIYDKYLEFNQISTESCISKEVLISKGFWSAIKSKSGIFDYRKNTLYKDTTSYVAVPLVLSVVPHYRVKDLFNFAKDIYKKKLLFNDDIPEDEMRFKIYETLSDLKEKNYINDRYDDKKIGDYYLCAYTKCCIQTGKCIDDLITIISECIKTIICFLTLPDDAYEVPEFYKEGFELWKSSFNEKDLFEENVLLSKPIFYFDGKFIHIRTGKINMDSRFDPNNVQIKLYSNDVEFLTKNLNGVNDIEFDYKDDIVGGYTINRIDIKLDKSPLENISYKIFADEKQIYSSKNNLYRKNLFIDEKGYEIKPGYNFNGELKVFTKERQVDESYDLIELYSFDNYFIYSAIVDSQTTYIFDDNAYVFYKIEKPEIIGYTIPWALVENDGKSYPIYKDQSFVFRTAVPLEDLVYVVDGIEYKFSENNDIHSISIYAKEHNEYNTYIIKLDYLSVGYHSLKVFNSKTEEMIKGCSFGFISDSNFKRRVERVEKGNNFTYESELLNGQGTLFYEHGCTSKTIDIFVKELGYSKLILFPSDFTYSIDGTEWFDRDHDMTLFSVQPSINKILICGPDNALIYYFDENRNKIPLSLSNVEGEKYKYYLYLNQLRMLSLSGFRDKKIYLIAGNKPKYMFVKFTPDVDKGGSVIEYNEANHSFDFKVKMIECDFIWAKVYDTHNKDLIYFSKKIKSNEVFSVSEDQINDNTYSLSLSLFMINSSSILQKPLEVPFFTFEKYEIPSKIVVFGNQDEACDVWFEDKNKFLCFRTNFSGPKSIKLLVVPTGKFFEGVEILNTDIKSDETIRFDISKSIFNSFFVRLLNSGENVDSRWLYHKKIDNDMNPFLNKRFNVSEYRSAVKDIFPDNISIKTKTIRKIDTMFGSMCLIGCDVFRNTVKDYYEYLLDVESIDDNNITFRVCGEIPNHGLGQPKSLPGTVKIVVRR